MNCPNCNCEIAPDSDSCPNCGADIAKEEYKSVLNEVLDEAVEPEEIAESVAEIMADEEILDGSEDYIDEQDYEQLMNEIFQDLDEDETEEEQTEFEEEIEDQYEDIFSSIEAENEEDLDIIQEANEESFDSIDSIYDEMEEQLSFTPQIKKKKLSIGAKIAIIAAAVVLVIAVIIGGFFGLRAMGIFSTGHSVSGEYVVADKKWVYYANPMDGNKLYKYNMKKPSEEAVKLTDESVRYLSVMGNYVYYSAETNDGLLKAVSINGESKKTDISTMPAEYVACLDSNIYFSNPGEEGQIYRINAAGIADQVKNAKGTNIVVVKGKIYYIYNGVLSCTKISGNKDKLDIAENIVDFDTNGDNIIAIDVNGNLLYFDNIAADSQPTETGISNVEDVYLDNNGHKFTYIDQSGMIYQSSISANQPEQQLADAYDTFFSSSKIVAAVDDEIGVITLKSDEETKLEMPKTDLLMNLTAPSGNAVNQAYAAIDNDYLYYLDYSENSIMKINADGTGDAQMVAAVPGAYITVHDGWIYYADYSTGGLLYRIRPDGTQSTRITVEAVNNVIIYGDWIYYITINNDLNEYYIKRTSNDGFVTNTIFTGTVGSMVIADGWIYYTTTNEDQSQSLLCRVRTDGQYNQTILTDVGMSVCEYDERLYYTDEEYHLYSCDLNGLNIQDTSLYAISFIVDDDTIYYSDIENNYLNKAALDGTNSTVLTEKASFGISSCGNLLVFASYEQAISDFAINCVGKDGLNLHQIG